MQRDAPAPAPSGSQTAAAPGETSVEFPQQIKSQSCQAAQQVQPRCLPEENGHWREGVCPHSCPPPCSLQPPVQSQARAAAQGSVSRREDTESVTTGKGLHGTVRSEKRHTDTQAVRSHLPVGSTKTRNRVNKPSENRPRDAENSLTAAEGEGWGVGI